MNERPNATLLNNNAVIYPKEKFLKEIKQLDIILKQYPNDLKALVRKGHALSNLGRLEEGLEYLAKAVKLYPNDCNALCFYGHTLCFLKRFEEAITYFDKCIKLEPKFYNAYNGKGSALIALQDYKRAIICFNISISINPQDFDANNNKSLALTLLGQCEGSFNAYDKMPDDNESPQVFLYNKANSLLTFNRYSEAIVYFDKCMSIKHGTDFYKLALKHKAECLYMTDRFKEALVCSEQLLDMEPDKIENLKNKGIALQKLERYDEALEVFEKTIKIDPNFVEGIGYASFCLLKLNRCAESVKYSTRCIKLIDEKDESKSELLNTMKDNLLIAFNCDRIDQENKGKADDFYQILTKFEI